MRRCPPVGRAGPSRICVLIGTQGEISSLSLMSVGHENHPRRSHSDLSSKTLSCRTWMRDSTEQSMEKEILQEPTSRCFMLKTCMVVYGGICFKVIGRIPKGRWC